MSYTAPKGPLTGDTVNVKVFCEGLHIDKALSLFKKKVKESGVLELYRERAEFVKPSAKRRAKRLAAKRKAQLPNEEDIL